ncbi:MAG: hypothetical protein P4L81_03935 [Candidatus Pacebacteria bacterium]|nr:hypothetical protein [Candidatus Paceibacterota bacterium]
MRIPGSYLSLADKSDKDKVAEWKRGFVRQHDRAIFHNLGCLQHDTCSSCYRRYVRPYRAPDSRAKLYPTGRLYDTREDTARLFAILPKVMADLEPTRTHHSVTDDQGRTDEYDTVSLWINHIICSICDGYLAQGLMPRASMQNNLLLPPVPPELAHLSYMERHLISRVRPFHQLVYLPYGQVAAKGLSISYPSDVCQLRTVLPAPLDESDVVFVRTIPSGRPGSGVQSSTRNMIAVYVPLKCAGPT